MTESEQNFGDYIANPEEDDAPWQLAVPAEMAGLRLDQALARLCPEHSRSRLQEWIAEGKVLLAGKAVATKYKVWGGESIEVWPQRHPAEQPARAEAIPLDIVYQDAELIVINKPVGLVVHPGSGNWSGTLLNGLLHHDPALAAVPRAGIVHRLDKDTSGLLVVARTLTAQTALVRQLQARSVKREYLALAWGEVRASGTVDAPIGRHPTQRTKMAVVESGKPAVTHYRPEAAYDSCTLLRCRLETGRTHQIRVHMAHIGHPLVGDALYVPGAQRCSVALRPVLQAFPRQALHATALGLIHPRSGEAMGWHAPLPDDMAALLAAIEAAEEDDAD